MAITNSAADKALSIPELLEPTLVELPPFQLIKLQRTNKTFKAVIERSQKIRQKLFYKGNVGDEDDSSNINPLLPLVLRHHSIGGKVGVFSGRNCGDSCVSTTEDCQTLISKQTYRADTIRSIVFNLHCFKPELVKPAILNSSYKDMLIAGAGVEITACFWNCLNTKVRVETTGQLLEALCLDHMQYSNWRY